MRPLNASVSFSRAGTHSQTRESQSTCRSAAERFTATASVKVASEKLIGGGTLSFACSLRNSFIVKTALRIGKSGTAVGTLVVLPFGVALLRAPSRVVEAAAVRGMVFRVLSASVRESA